MIDRRVLAVSVLLATVDAASSQIQRENCKTSGPSFYFEQNSKISLDTEMDHNGCRYSFFSAGSASSTHFRANIIFEKAVTAKEPANGKLSQTGAYSFFYHPHKGFKGKDSFVIYVCGSSPSGSGCARLSYNATVK